MAHVLRVSDKSMETLRELKQQTGKPMSKLVNEAIEIMRRSYILNATTIAYADKQE